MQDKKDLYLPQILHAVIIAHPTWTPEEIANKADDIAIIITNLQKTEHEQNT